MVSLDIILAEADELVFSRRGPHVEGGKKAILLVLGLDLRLERLSHIEREPLDNIIDVIRMPISINQIAVVEWGSIGLCVSHGVP